MPRSTRGDRSSHRCVAAQYQAGTDTVVRLRMLAEPSQGLNARQIISQRNMRAFRVRMLTQVAGAERASSSQRASMPCASAPSAQGCTRDTSSKVQEASTARVRLPCDAQVCVLTSGSATRPQAPIAPAKWLRALRSIFTSLPNAKVARARQCAQTQGGCQ